MSSLRLVLCVALLAACGGDDDGPSGDASGGGDGAQQDGAGGGGDGGGGGIDGGGAATGHESYVPPGLRPTEGVRLIVMGDSISRGSGASTTARRYGSLLDAELTTFFGNDVELINVAVGGSTTDALATSQLDDLRERLGATVEGHTILVLTSGGNDMTHALRDGMDPVGATLEDAIADLRTMVAFFRDTTRFPDGVSIYVAAVYDPTDGTGNAGADCFEGLTLRGIPGWIDMWRDAYRTLAVELGFAMIDALGHFHGHGFHFDEPANDYYDAADPTLWFADCVHPNDVGHAQMSGLFHEAIDPSFSLP